MRARSTRQSSARQYPVRELTRAIMHLSVSELRLRLLARGHRVWRQGSLVADGAAPSGQDDWGGVSMRQHGGSPSSSWPPVSLRMRLLCYCSQLRAAVCCQLRSHLPSAADALGRRRDRARGRRLAAQHRCTSSTPLLHRWLGRLYVVAVIVGALGAGLLAPGSQEGVVTHWDLAVSRLVVRYHDCGLSCDSPSRPGRAPVLDASKLCPHLCRRYSASISVFQSGRGLAV